MRQGFPEPSFLTTRKITFQAIKVIKGAHFGILWLACPAFIVCDVTTQSYCMCVYTENVINDRWARGKINVPFTKGISERRLSVWITPHDSEWL